MGLMDLTRASVKRDPQILAAIQILARDRVPEVRLKIVQNLGMLGTLDPNFAWSETEYVLKKERTRGVVSGAMTALCRLSHQDVPRAVRHAKGLVTRYGSKNGPGMATCQGLARTFIFDIHIYQEFPEADAFAAAMIGELARNSEIVRQLVARYSDTLLKGDVHNPHAENNRPRQRTLAFYGGITESALGGIEERFKKLGLQKFNTWPAPDQDTVRDYFGVLDEVSLRLQFAAGTHSSGSHQMKIFLQSGRGYTGKLNRCSRAWPVPSSLQLRII